MQMDILRGKSPDRIRKEIAVHFLAYNLIRTVMAQAACLAHRLPRQLSFKASLQVLNAFEENLRLRPASYLPGHRARLHRSTNPAGSPWACRISGRQATT
jgi:hypothetical protein